MRRNILKYGRFTFALVLALALFSLSAGVGADSAGLVASPNAPRLKVDHSETLNWSGYAAETNLKNPANGAVTDVSGSWTVPTANCSQVKSLALSAAWLGMDGYSDSTVEQVGTDQDCSGTTPYYYAWYEMYPARTQVISMTISAGDVMTAEVKYVGSNQFQLSIGDTTTGASFSTIQTATANRSSAEWVLEAPGMGTSFPLTDFGTIQFTSAKTTIGGSTGPIDDSSWQNDPMTMVNHRGQVKASPSGLTDKHNTSTFSVTWERSR